MFICQPLTTSDVIQIAGIFASLITSIVAIVISLISMRQNSKMIEESTRPYIVVYTRTTNFQSPEYYFIVKNFGQTGALVTSFECDFDFSQCSYSQTNIPFQHFSNTYIAPNQSYICNVDPIKLFKNPQDMHFSVSYSAGNKKYSDTFTIHPVADSDLIQTRAATKGKELRNISYTLQDLVEKFL